MPAMVTDAVVVLNGEATISRARDNTPGDCCPLGRPDPHMSMVIRAFPRAIQSNHNESQSHYFSILYGTLPVQADVH